MGWADGYPVTLADLSRLMIESLDGGHGTVTITYRVPTPGKGDPHWAMEARGERLPPTYGLWKRGETLEEVLEKEYE